MHYHRHALNGQLSDAIEAMLANYVSSGNALTGKERSGMIGYVNDEFISGNHQLKDNENVASLLSVNGAVDFVGGTVGTLFNSPGHTVSGYALDGINQYYDSLYNIVADGVNASQDNVLLSVFIQDESLIVDTTAIIGQSSTAGAGTIWCYLTGTSHRARFHAASIGVHAGTSRNVVPTTISYGRNISTQQQFYEDGVSKSPQNISSDGAKSLDLFVGRAAGLFGKFTFSDFMAAGSVGFDHVAHDKNLRRLLTTLGAI